MIRLVTVDPVLPVLLLFFLDADFFRRAFLAAVAHVFSVWLRGPPDTFAID